MAYRGMGQSMLATHRGPSAVPVFTPPVRRPVVMPPAPAASPTPNGPVISQNPILGQPGVLPPGTQLNASSPVSAWSMLLGPSASGQAYSSWLNAFGAPGTASRNAVPMSCIMGGIGCPSGVAGFGDYDKTANWSWMYNPPPYDFLDAPGVKAPPEFYAPATSMGLGCGNSGGCGCGCKKKGIGQADATGLFGTSLFSSTDFTQWGWGEWATIAAAAYVAYNLTSDVKGIQRTVKRSRSKSARRQRLRDEAESI